MSTRRFFLAKPPSGGIANLQRNEAHHLVHVLRARIGDRIELIDGSGRTWSGEIARLSPETVDLNNVLMIEEQLTPSIPLVLLQALCRQDRLEWTLQKTTELGVTEIYLVESERSIVKFPQVRIEAKVARWNKIIIGAAKQSHRSTLPRLHPPLSCDCVCEQLEAELKILFTENERTRSLKGILRSRQWHSVAYCIGPEGGWAPNEEALFCRYQFQSTTLGTNILRTETAAIVALAVLKYELEDSLERKSTERPFSDRREGHS